MADADVTITAGTGTKIDTRTVGAGTDEHRQVVVLGDPSTAAAVAPVSATDGLLVNLGSNNDVTVTGTVTANLAAGTNNVGDVDVLSVVPGTGATSLGKAEDAQHASGDTGVMALAVRQDTPAALATTDADYAPLEVGAVGQLHVGLVGHSTTTRIAVNASGLTTATTAYSDGDVLGGELTFAAAARISGGRGVVEGAVLLDKSAVMVPTELFLFRAASTPASNNAANSWSDTDMENLVGTIYFVPTTSALNRYAHWTGALPYECAATSLFGVLVTRGVPTGSGFFGAATDLRVTLFVRYE